MFKCYKPSVSRSVIVFTLILKNSYLGLTLHSKTFTHSFLGLSSSSHMGSAHGGSRRGKKELSLSAVLFYLKQKPPRLDRNQPTSAPPPSARPRSMAAGPSFPPFHTHLSVGLWLRLLFMATLDLERRDGERKMSKARMRKGRASLQMPASHTLWDGWQVRVQWGSHRKWMINRVIMWRLIRKKTT